MHIINIDVQDNHEEATIGAFLIYKMAQSLANSKDLDNDIDELLQELESTVNRPLLHTIAFQWSFQNDVNFLIPWNEHLAYR